MVAGNLNKKSKRMSCRRRYKIEKKVREHNKKLRRELKKKNLRKPKPEKPLEVQIPNKCPFKEEILIETKKRREKLEVEKEKRRESVKKQRKESKAKKLAEKRWEIAKPDKKEKAKSLESLVASAQERQEEFLSEHPGASLADYKDAGSQEDSSVKAYAGEVRKVLDQADVILEVLDARDPLGCRCTHVEEAVVGKRKRLVLLLNKVDLVPKENVEKWIKYLRNEFPTIAFKASTQEQKTKLGRAGSNLSCVSSKCLGADLVMKILGNYCRSLDIKTSIRVGVVGFPNVGKSSVINSLKRTRTCNVGATPGVTKTVQEVDLDKHIKLLDSPGVVLARKGCVDNVEVALKNAVRVEMIRDPVSPVEAILRRCSKEMLMVQYNIGDFENVDSFLALAAKKMGKFKKGARPDVNGAARKVLNDWNTGKIRYYTEPPEKRQKPAFISSELVTEMSKEFDLDTLIVDETKMMEDLPNTANSDAVLYEAEASVVSDGNEMEVDNSGGQTVVTELVDRSKGDSLAKDKKAPESLLPGNQQANKATRKAQKREKKKRRKNDEVMGGLADNMIMSMDLDEGEKYDFEQDFHTGN